MAKRRESASILCSIEGMDQVLEEHQGLQSQIEALREQIKSKAREAFEKGIAKLFNRFPGLQTIRWTQYTPYFNDGDECTFSSNHCDNSLNTEDAYRDYGYGDASDFPEGITKEIQDTVDDFLSKFDDEDMRNMFGDHVQVTVTSNGIETDDYEHD